MEIGPVRHAGTGAGAARSRQRRETVHSGDANGVRLAAGFNQPHSASRKGR
jgi:hypothetical protein